MFARVWHAAAGGRAPFVLFHDSLGCVELWRDFPPALAEATGRSVIAYDRLGFGRSARREGPIGLHLVEVEAASFVPAMRAQLAIGRFIALGHSVGGAMAVHAAAADECVGVITIAAQSFVEDRTVAGVARAKQRFREDGQLARLARYHGDRAAWVFEAWTATWTDPAFASWSLDGALARLRCPVLVIHGGRDEYASTRHAERIAARAAGPARVAILPEAGHFPHREDPAGVIALVAGFVGAIE
jgi:pimeloyl-ACP methyl ester carboxylesterase